MDSAPPRLSIVLPTYNERDSLARLDPELESALAGRSAEIVVVDDASPDGTAAFVRSLRGAVPHIVIERGGKQGLASAVLAGIAESHGSIVVVMDADGSHSPTAIPALVDAIDRGAEFALASRTIAGGSSEGLSVGRRWMSLAATWMARPLARVSDPMSGFFAVRRSVLARASLAPQGFKIGLEILVRCRPHPIAEVPIHFRPRFAGESKLGGNEVRNYLAHLTSLYRARWGEESSPR